MQYLYSFRLQFETHRSVECVYLLGMNRRRTSQHVRDVNIQLIERKQKWEMEENGESEQQ